MIKQLTIFIFLIFGIFGTPATNPKVCDVAVLLDPYFVQQYGERSMDLIMMSNQRVSKIYADNFGISLPIGNVVSLGNEYLPILKSKSSKELLGKMQNIIANNAFRNQNIYLGSHCLIQLYTHQDFGLNLGETYTGDSTGGACSVNYNMGVLNTRLHNLPISLETLVLTTAHETGHSFGALHDSNECSDQKHIMNAIVSSDLNSETFSTCSISSISNFISQNIYKTCFQ